MAKFKDDANAFNVRALDYLKAYRRYVASGISPAPRTVRTFWAFHRQLEAWRSALNWRQASRSGGQVTATVLLAPVLTIACIVLPLVAFFGLGVEENASISFSYNIDLVEAAVGSALTIVAAFAAAAYISSARLPPDSSPSGGIPPLPAPPWPEPPAPAEGEAEITPESGAFTIE